MKTTINGSNTILRPETREQWLEVRKSGIGSSEVATILGFNPFDTPRELWMRKRGIKPPVVENNAMRLGHLLEDAVAQMWAEDTGHTIIKRSAIDWIIRDNVREYLQVSPDRTYWIDANGKRNMANKGILEIKTTQRAVDPDNIPWHWFIQVQYQLGVAGLAEGYIAWLTGGRDFGHKKITFNQAFFDYIVNEVDRFYHDNIVGGLEPLPINSADLLDKYSTHAAGEYATASDDTYSAYLQLKEVRRSLDDLTAQKDALEERLKLACQGYEGVKTADGFTLCTWKSGKPVTKVDTKAMLADNPALAEKYTTTTTTARRFLLK